MDLNQSFAQSLELRNPSWMQVAEAAALAKVSYFIGVSLF